jgi:hypothetical protein
MAASIAPRVRLPWLEQWKRHFGARRGVLQAEKRPYASWIDEKAR